MPKVNSPLFSSVSGTLNRSITFRANHRAASITMLQRPVPTDPRTPAQAAIRNAYRRLAETWKTISPLEKSPYQVIAKARHITAWNAWLAVHMPLMRRAPYFYCPCVEGSGPLVSDLAIGGIPGELYNATWTEKNGFGGISFDGSNDGVLFDRADYYDTHPDFSIFLIYDHPPNLAQTGYHIGTRMYFSGLDGFRMQIDPDRSLGVTIGNGSAYDVAWSNFDLIPNAVNIIAFTRSGTDFRYEINGVVTEGTIGVTGLATSGLPLSLGVNYYLLDDLLGSVYLAALFPRALDPADLAALRQHYRPLYGAV